MKMASKAGKRRREGEREKRRINNRNDGDVVAGHLRQFILIESWCVMKSHVVPCRSETNSRIDYSF